jgi:TRAP transporter TAXI family solute receptor
MGSSCHPPLRLLFSSMIALAVASSIACSTPEATGRAPARSSDSARPLRLLTGPSTGAYLPLGRALADAYNSRLSSVHVTAAMTEGPEGAGANAQALDAGKADLGFSRADIAYQEYRQPPQGTTSHLRSIAVIYINAVHLVVRRASGITRGEEIRGHRVQMSEESGSGGGGLARLVVEGYGLTEHDVHAVGSARSAIARLKSGELDVRIFASAYPLDTIEDVGPSSPIALLSIDSAVINRLRSRFPFFKPTVIPKGSYKGQSEDIQTVGIDGLLLCRDSMPESVVYDLTKTLFEALPALAKTHNSARMIDVVNAPATPVPLHPGAARYYRERDLFR